MAEMGGLVSVQQGDNIIITPNKDSKNFLSYLRNNINMLGEKDRKEFISGTEAIIRISKDYKKYIGELKNKYPGTHSCALFNNIDDTMAPIEMHHGPIFTLAEICVIVLNHYIKNGKEVDSFDIADEILQDHFDGLVQTIFLCKMAHNIVSNKKIQKNAFIPLSTAIGDLVGFIEKYNDAITYYEINKIRNYIYLADLYDKEQSSSIFDYLKERVKSVKDNEFKEMKDA
ncbi:MAG: hypothetical protein IJ772_05110 [Bacilli bacterium]|nr:hypothetical protein [Bacilli bacterium]